MAMKWQKKTRPVSVNWYFCLNHSYCQKVKDVILDWNVKLNISCESQLESPVFTRKKKNAHEKLTSLVLLVSEYFLWESTKDYMNGRQEGGNKTDGRVTSNFCDIGGT